MTPFFITIEILSLVYIGYLFLKKRELAIIYLPVLFFASNLIEPTLPASVSYVLTSLLVFSIIFVNPSFYKYNFPAFLLFLYFLVLLPRSSNLELIRPYIFSVSWLLLLIPAVSSIYQKYSREVIFKELQSAAISILVLFIVNVLFSTAKGYSPHEMYGITTGILFGNLYATDFNILAIALFVATLGFINNRNILTLLVIFTTLAFITLSLRRSVMLMSFLGVGIPYLTLLTRERAKMFFLLGFLTFSIGFVVYSATSLADSFKERYELRKLDERELEEEKRFIEYELLYKDMFVYHDYGPLLGKELFNSWGKYGRGVLGDRSLHGDLTSITHSSGIIGLVIYLCMVFTAFRSSYNAANTRSDKLLIGFCVIAFGIYTITGRYTNVSATLMLYLLLALPLSQTDAEQDAPDTTEEEQEDELTLFHKRLKQRYA